MLLHVRVFGGLVERTGLRTLPIEVSEGATVAELRRAVIAAHPQLAALLPRVAIAVDLEVVDDGFTLALSHEVALLPPVAGGAGGASDDAPDAAVPGVTLTGLVQGPIAIKETLARLEAADVGAIVSFLGTVRDHAADLEQVVRLEYSAYEAMAERELATIAAELRAARPALRGIALLHAIGDLAVGEHTVLIAVSSAHREDAFDACRAALDAVKDRVPVFKREVTADGRHRWVGLPGDSAP